METLDCRGLACPQPVVRCRAFLEDLRPRRCAVLVDNAASAENVARFLEGRGYAVETRREEGLWRLNAAADEGGSGPEPETLSAGASVPAGEHGKILALIAAETLGRGSEELGAKLMAAFLNTLPEMGEALWRVVLLNGGVKLSAVPGPALDALRRLEAGGVGILACGACLAHYGLTTARAVGETSNMLDIVASLTLADKVIRP